MSHWTADQINSIFSTQLAHGWQANGISIDSRTLQPGEIYVALKGAKLDGHAYVDSAAQAGASAALVDHPVASSIPQIVVPDVLEGLRMLAQASRSRTKARIAGVTGSVGKTSTKEALNLVLNDQAPTYVTPRSFNNHWGLPLAVALMPEDVTYAVLEMGMNSQGEIASHTNLAKPHVAYITNVEGIHIGKLGSIANIALAKAEIFQGLQLGGIAIYNQDTNEAQILDKAARSATQQVWRIGRGSGSEIRLLSVDDNANHQVIQVDILGERLTYRLNVLGGHWAMNSLGILAVVKALGADVARAADKLADFGAVAGRGKMHTIHLANGGQMLVIDESYNAGPVSVRAALDVLRRAHCPGESRRIAVLGDMLELGESEKAEHVNLRDEIIHTGVDLVFTSGERMAELSKALPADVRGMHIDDPKVLAQEISQQARPGDIYMVKGSRGGYQAHGRMYAVVESLLALNQKQG